MILQLWAGEREGQAMAEPFVAKALGWFSLLGQSCNSDHEHSKHQDSIAFSLHLFWKTCGSLNTTFAFQDQVTTERYHPNGFNVYGLMQSSASIFKNSQVFTDMG